MNVEEKPVISMQFKYTPDSDLKLHEEGAIRLICSSFQSHENGIPEWVKNSADAYSREGISQAERIIILFFSHFSKHGKSSISCLDFVGMSCDDIEIYFRLWADPNAAKAGNETSDVQGGHGNGGKCYMTQMFDNYSQLHTVKNGLGCIYGVPKNSFRFGYIPDQEKGKNFKVENILNELQNVLANIQCSVDSFPKSILKKINYTKGFSLFSGFAPKGYEKKIPSNQLIKEIIEHPQMTRNIETCKIYFIVNGKLENLGKPINLKKIVPMQGYENPLEIEIPSNIKDPKTNEMISTTERGALHKGNLTLYTSEKSMKYGMRARHTIRFLSNNLGDFGYIPITELDIQSSYKDHIYGICDLESLEKYKQNLRARLAESPLTRSIELFISEKIQKYAEEFEAKEKRKFDHEEKSEIKKMNEALDKWKNRFLNEVLQGLWGSGIGTTQVPPRIPLPKGKIAKIELILSHKKAGLGVSFRPIVHFIGIDGKELQASPIRIVSEDNNVAFFDEELFQITTTSIGQTFIYAETLDSQIQSSKIPLEVIKIKEIQITPQIIELDAGSRQKFDAICTLSKNDETSDVYLIWTEDNPNVARVSSAGLVFAFSPGETGVIAGDDKCQAKKQAIIKVSASEGRRAGGKKGKGYPQILISGINPDPETNEIVQFPSDDPPVVQRPEDTSRNIWWINSSAPLAKLYLDSSKGYGVYSREWRAYHIERYIEILIQIILQNGPEENPTFSLDQWVIKWGQYASELQNAAASDLLDFIHTGELPI